MSRTATATPPQPYFPARTTTPSMRHHSPSPVTAAHFVSRHKSHTPKRKTKNLPTSLVGALSPGETKGAVGSPSRQDALGLSFEEFPSFPAQSGGFETIGRTESHTSAFSSNSLQSVDSVDTEADMRAPTPTPSMTTSSSASFVATPLPTPSSSRTPSLLQGEASVANGSVEVLPLAPLPVAPSARTSWVPNFGKMAKAVVSTGINMSMPFAEKRRKDVTSPSSTAIVKPESPPTHDAVFFPTFPQPQPSRQELEQLSEEAAMERRREWAAAEQRRVTECARLCSQWPYSGYNQSKWGPNGAKHFYEPQSYANPQYVASLMSRQAELERWLCESSNLFFSCGRPRSSRAGSEETDSYESSQPSPSASMCLTADISAAMASPLIPSSNVNASQISLLMTSSPKSMMGQRSLTDLDVLTSSMALESSVMDVDSDSLANSTNSLPPALSVTRPARAQSCGAKRPMLSQGEEEEKRRKVDEAMVVEEAVHSGVIMPASQHNTASNGQKQMSASVPDLSKASIDANPGSGPAMFGHVVKTSDTHPIIISPFFPTELIGTIAEHLVVPSSLASKLNSSDELLTATDHLPFILGSKIDIPSLLLSYVPQHQSQQAQFRGRVAGAIVPSPVNSVFLDANQVHGPNTGTELGNLLLSSCPGKRLRMEGPVKGRGPVCRDLATDLRRIKNEGVGALVCCLDDPELALLGVPWDTYRQVATETGLDVIRMPMPDGFTPVSLGLFDSQVSMIATQYSLKGINVLVHCRGGVGRAGLTACAWAIKMGFVPPHPSLAVVEEAASRQAQAQQNRKVELPAELEHQIVMSVVERVIAMIRARRGLKAIESFEQVQFLVSYVRWLRDSVRQKGQY